METFDYQKRTQDRVLKELKQADLSNPDWHKSIISLEASIVIWFLKELVEKREFLDEIFELAKIYATDSDPALGYDNLNERTGRGEEINNIYTTRGTVCWLLASLVATFRTEFYPDIISTLERLAVDPVYYVRIQATVPLSFFARNIRALHHADGTPFNFMDEDRERVVELSFQMLKSHRDLPRVLEGVINIFEVLRDINEFQAQQVIEYFFYNSKGELQPEYLTHQGVPLLIFFAEFRSNLNDGFNGEWFQNFAYTLLDLPEKDAPYLRSTFMWHTWRTIQSDAQTYLRFKKYIQFFFKKEFETQPLGQYDFLVSEVLKVSAPDGIALFNTLLEYVLEWAPKYDIQQHTWLLTTYEIVEEIARVSPGDLLNVLRKITSIVSKGIYVGYLENIYKSYLLVPDKEEGMSMHPEILRMYEVAKQSRWADKLPDTI